MEKTTENSKYYILFTIPFLVCILLPLFLKIHPTPDTIEPVFRLLLPSIFLLLSVPISTFLVVNKKMSYGVFIVPLLLSLLLIGKPAEDFANGINSLIVKETRSNAAIFVKYEIINKPKYYKEYLVYKTPKNRIAKEETKSLKTKIEKLDIQENDAITITYSKGVLDLYFISDIKKN